MSAVGGPLTGGPLTGGPLTGSPLTGSPLTGSPLTGSPLTGSPLTGTGAMVRFALRRDRVKLPVWVLAIAAFVPYFYFGAAAIAFPTREALLEAVQLTEIPLMRVFTGPVFGLDDITPERYFLAAYDVEFLLAAILMSILLVARHTRGEEQTGRAELIRAAVVGRHASLTAALVVAGIANLALAVIITGAALGIGFPPGSALLFGTGIGAVGLVFAGVTAVTAQLAERSRAAAGLAAVVLGVVWVLRAVGAVQAVEGSPVTWLSPMAWSQQTRVLADERWWPLGLSVVLTAALVALAYALSARRDLGAGVIASRPGRASAGPWLRSSFALAFRLQRAAILWWGVALLAAGLVFGGLAGAMDIDPGSPILGAGADVTRSYLSLMAFGMACFVGVFTILSVTRLRADETRGLADPVLVGPTSRWAWLGSYLLATAIAATVLLAVAGISMGLGTAVSTGDGTLAREVTGAVLFRLPEALALLAVAAALFGLAPRAVRATWVVLAYGGFVTIFAPNLDWPGWLLNTSLLGQIPRLPLGEFALAPMLVLCVLAVALVGLGGYGFGRRDVDAR